MQQLFGRRSLSQTVLVRFFRKPGLLVLPVLWCLPVQLMAAPYVVYDPRAAAMGGATVALSGRYAVVQNMALAGRAQEFVDWNLALPAIGWETTDASGFVPALTSYQLNPNQNDLQDMAGYTRSHHEYAAVVATVPSDIFAGGLFLLQDEYRGQRVVMDTSDSARVLSNSYVEKRALQFTQHGVGIARYHESVLGVLRNVTVGYVPKLILARSTLYRESVDIADTAIIYPSADTQHHSAFNLDLSILKEVSRFSSLAVSLQNVLPMSFRYSSVYAGRALVNPQARLGFAYERRDRTFAVDVDLTSNPDIAFTSRSRIIAGGGEYAFGEYFRLRGGLKFNLLGEQEMLLTGGAGIEVKGHRIDLAIQDGPGVSGASAHLNIQF